MTNLIIAIATVFLQSHMTSAIDAPPLRICPLCGRDIPLALESRHHLVPKLKGGKGTESNIVVLHKPCHSKLHATLTERELARYYSSVEALLQHPEISKFAEWVSKRPIDFSESMPNLRKQKERKRRRR